ncbi:hypothetical protein AWR36_012430 [Microbulbifer flavimaris]|uniref:Holin-X, holin superfamily III n=1 Tax=Microbulbifer flavimaris TaxID=1781068 RepID=A0ABX4HXM6_9GAMM|nr:MULTISPECIES: hypothetical protein [Microbulbifer]KUJ82586.1 hypothetical protein AVO43_12395 [Microbulbifer sp. ZGT114]PCO04796.1 hypothetical protein AWR36_012430 [Microbulbifer flavimaris]
MKDDNQSDSHTTNPDPAAPPRGRHTSGSDPEASPGQPGQTEPSTLDRAEATLTLVSAWTSNLQTLMRLEFDRTMAAGKRIVGLSLVLLPLAIAFLLSLCAGVGLISYYFTDSPYIGFVGFLLAQLLLLAAILLYQNRLRSLLGFTQTRQQVMEAIDDVRETFK